MNNTPDPIRDILHHLTNQAYYTDADYAEAKAAIQALIAKEVLRGKREEVIEIVSWGSKGQDRAIKRLAELNKQIGDSDDRRTRRDIKQTGLGL